MMISSLSTLLADAENQLIPFEFPKIDALNLSTEPLAILGLIVLSIGLGILFANAVRMKDYGWKIGLILSTLTVSLFVVLFGHYRLGVDLKGGVILVYEVDERETAALNPDENSEQWQMGELVRVIGRRLNPDGLKEIVVRPFGQKQIEIVVPETDPEAIKDLEELIETAGVLQFMIVAEPDKDVDLFETARDQAERKGIESLRRDVKDAEGERIGYWATLGREDKPAVEGELPPFLDLEVDTLSGLLRDSRTGQIIELTAQQIGAFVSSQSVFQEFLDRRGTRDVDVLLVYDADNDLRGDDLGGTGRGMDDNLRACIEFTMRDEGAIKMGTLTQDNLQRNLAIVFDNQLISAPVIQSRIDDRGQITGSFSNERINLIVSTLKTGSMPVVLQKRPISKNLIGSILGRDTITKGSYSVVIALGLVLLFIAAYYRVAGLVACFALTLNLLLTVGIMVLLQAPFTLPGLAGLVLTVAMSIDANVLIFERIREELERGAALRMAIRNGFDRALSAIIDGNLTTLLVSIVLYAIGTDQVRGFGITLMLGNITSMFTAIFCARVILDVIERTRWVKTLSMGNFLTHPNVDWVRFIGPAMVGSLVLIVVGLVATVARGRGIFDIDLAGGTSVVFILKEPMPDADVRRMLDEKFDSMVDKTTKSKPDHNVYPISVQAEAPNTVYKVDSSLSEVEDLQLAVREAIKLPDGSGALKTFQVSFGDLKEEPIVAEEPPASPQPAIGDTPATDETPAPVTKEGPAIGAPADVPADKPEEKGKTEDKPAEDKSGEDKPADSKPAEKPTESEEKASDKSDGCQAEPAEEDAAAKSEESAKSAEEEKAATSAPEEPAAPAEDKPADDAKATPAEPAPATAESSTPAEPASPAGSAAAPAPTAPAPAAPTVKTTASLDFKSTPISGPALLERLNEAAIASLGKGVDAEVDNPSWDRIDNTPYEKWSVVLYVPQAQAGQILDQLKTDLADDVVWQTTSKIGGQVSVDTRWRAISALGISLLGIVAYVWFRFQNVAWGLAAVAALAHDALVMLTGIAASYWFASSLGFLGIEEFKISLPVVAAFLALLGYSVNDTIVIFDRLREIRGKSPYVTREMLNGAVNQTLGRTVILAGLTLLTVLILYIFGGPGIHAFAFALVIGVISGCYSTLVIASPLVLWLLGKPDPTAASAEKKARRGDEADRDARLAS